MTESEARAVLGVGYSTSKEDLKKTFKRLAARHHPDRSGDDTKFKLINEAYNLLLSRHIGDSVALMIEREFMEWSDVFDGVRNKNYDTD